jgi:hypothetical protein
VSFSEQVDIASVTNKSNYTISPAMAISEVTLDATLTNVFLKTPTQTQGASYAITVKNIQDLSGNVMTNTTKNFTGFVFGTGVVMRETYYGADGWGIYALTGLASFQNHKPDAINYLSIFEGPDSTPPANLTGWRFYGLLIPPETGEYQFFSYCEDEAYTYLSTDENPANLDTANPIIYETEGWNTYRNWGGDSSHWVTDHTEVMPRVIGPKVTSKPGFKTITAVTASASTGANPAIRPIRPTSPRPSAVSSWVGTSIPMTPPSPSRNRRLTSPPPRTKGKP